MELEPENTNIPKLEPKSIFQKHKKLIILCSTVLSLIVVIIGICIILKTKQTKQDLKNTDSKTQNTTVQTQDCNKNTTDILLNDIKTASSNIIVSRNKPQYAVYSRRLEQPLLYHPFQENGGSLDIFDELVALNLETGERQSYSIYDDLISQDILTTLESIPSEISYRLYPNLLNHNGNLFWGKASIYSYGDPPIAEETNLFSIDLDNNSKIEKFTIPNHNGLFGQINLFTSAQKVIYEIVTDGLFLYEYDLETRQERLIVNYNKNTFDKYCTGPVDYIATFYEGCGDKRGLQARWSSEGVAYLDFVTREVKYSAQK